MITTTLNEQNHISENFIGSVIYFFNLTEVPFVYMERAGFMTCTAASHQGAIKEPAASLLKRSEQVLQSAVWTIGAGRHVSLRPPSIPLVYNTANLIGVDPSMRIPLCTIL